MLILPAMMFGFQIRGRVFRSDTLAGIPSVAVVLKSGTNTLITARTEDNGSYIIDAPAGSYTMSAMAAGYYRESKEITLKSDINIYFYLIPQSSLYLSEIDITGEKLKDTESKNIMPKDLRGKAPESVTGDPLHSLTLMPGVEDLGIGDLQIGNLQDNTKLSVRGGTGNENAALLDDALIQYPYHHFIGDSVFIDDIVDSIDLYKGVLPAEHGQAMSSLLQVNTIEGEPGFHGKVDLGLINTYITLSGASEDQKWNFAGGIRRTQYDLVLPYFVQGSSNFHAPYYLDSQGKIQYKDGADTVSLVWLFSEESMHYTNFWLSNSGPNAVPANNVNDLGIMDYINSVINLDWKHSFSGEWSIDQSFGTMWNYDDLEITNPDSITFMKDSAYNLRYKGLAGYAPPGDVSFDIGLEIIYYPGLFYTNYIGGFADDRITGWEWLVFDNNSYQGTFGIYSAFIENRSDLFDKSIYIEDGLRFNYVDYIKKYSLDPRLTVGYRFTPRDRVYISVGYLSEFPSDSFDLAVLDTNAGLSIPGCWHYVLGTGLDFSSVFNISLEGYFKQYENYISRESNIEYLLQTAGEQRQIYGIDLLLTKKSDDFPLYGWLSLSSYFVRGYRTSGLDPDTLNLDQGSLIIGPELNIYGQYGSPPVDEWFDPGSLLYKLDLVVIWQLSKNWSFTSEFLWQSGSQYTPLASVQTNNSGNYTIYTPVWDTYNSARLPDVNSLNLKLEYTGMLFGLPSGVYLQVNNVYNYRPVTYVTYINNYSTMVENTNLIGIYPEVGVWMKW